MSTTSVSAGAAPASPVDASPRIRSAMAADWGAPWLTLLFTVAAVAAFTLVVHLVHFGFSARFGDPFGYLIAILKPLALTLPAYLLLRVVLGRRDLSTEVGSLSKSLRLAALSIACYAPVIWFYLLTSPTPTYPLIASFFGALVFWIPLAIDLVRRAPLNGRLLAVAWVALMLFGEGKGLVGHLAQELGQSAQVSRLEGEL